MSLIPPLEDRQSGPESPKESSVLRTYLELPTLADLRTAPTPAVTGRLDSIPACPVPRWRALYHQIGAAWHWHDRDQWPDDALAERLAREAVAIFEVAVQTPHGAWDRPVGFLELERHDDGSVEIVYLGLDRAVHGQGLGGWLVGEAARHAAAMGNGRVVLNTCTLDAPAALPNYLARGFRITRTETYTVTLPDAPPRV